MAVGPNNSFITLTVINVRKSFCISKHNPYPVDLGFCPQEVGLFWWFPVRVWWLDRLGVWHNQGGVSDHLVFVVMVGADGKGFVNVMVWCCCWHQPQLKPSPPAARISL